MGQPERGAQRRAQRIWIAHAPAGAESQGPVIAESRFELAALEAVGWEIVGPYALTADQPERKLRAPPGWIRSG